MTPAPVSEFWWRWLMAALSLTAVFGASMLLAPSVAEGLFGLVFYGRADAISRFGETAAAYVGLLHGVLGAVMLGWAVAMLIIAAGPFRQGQRWAWQALLASVAAWFISDTAFSLWSGFWQNALLNLLFGIGLGLPLIATRRAFLAAKGAG